MTGSEQNFARKMKIPIDSIDFDFITLDNDMDTQQRPVDGVLTYGLFLEGAGWDYQAHVLCESEPKVRIGLMPTEYRAAAGCTAYLASPNMHTLRGTMRCCTRSLSGLADAGDWLCMCSCQQFLAKHP